MTLHLFWNDLVLVAKIGGIVISLGLLLGCVSAVMALLSGAAKEAPQPPMLRRDYDPIDGLGLRGLSRAPIRRGNK